MEYGIAFYVWNMVVDNKNEINTKGKDSFKIKEKKVRIFLTFVRLSECYEAKSVNYNKLPSKQLAESWLLASVFVQ